MNIKLLIAYEGTAYFGWQKTIDGPSIEEMLEKALEQILQEKVTLQASSRTDRGVHAEGQVVNFIARISHDISTLKRSVNALLPPDIRVLNIEIADDTFHPTLDAKSKEYHYHIQLGPHFSPFTRRFAWHVHYPLDLKQMLKAKNHFIGRHDFACLSNQTIPLPKDTHREIFSINILNPTQDTLLFEILGDHFLYKMVRNIVGTLVYVGRGRILEKEIPNILKGKDRREAGVTAPAHGLTLKRILFEITEAKL